MKVRTTAAQLADKLKISYVIAAGLLCYLEDTKKAKIVDKIRHSSGKGKPTRVYELDKILSLDLSCLEGTET